MLPTTILVALGAGIGIVALAYLGAGKLAEQRWGRLALLVALLALPLLVSAGNVSYGFQESSQTRFCLSCHEMQAYGQSLFVDNKFALSATHYQNRLIDRDRTCYTCHADYGMFGDLKAKMNGLRHVWVHYLGDIPKKPTLYEAYSSRNCLHCHDDARRFQESPAHRPVLDELYAGTKSCLGCHTVAHDLKSVEAHRFWEAR